jgi:soluble lytic murein transglycosylase
MAQVRIYQGGAIQRQGTTDARLRVVDNGPNPLAVGLQDTGKALGEFAERQDRIQEIYDRQDADKLSLQHVGVVRELRSTVREARGADAQAAVTEAQRSLAEQTQKLLSTARSPRAKALLEHDVIPRNAEETDNWETHGYNEFVTDRRATLDAKANTAIEEAADAPDDAAAQEKIRLAADAAEERMRFDGHTDPSVIGQARAKATSKGYVTRAQQLNAQDRPEEAWAYLDAHKGEILSDDEQALRTALKGQLDDMAADSDAAAAQGFGHTAAPEGTPTALPPGETGFLPPVRVHTVTVKGGQFGAPRSYGGHVGRDYAGMPAGTPVYPMAEGTVKHVFHSATGGNTVEIAMAGGWTMRVLHLQDGSTAHLQEGNPIGVNDQIGAVGNTGTASHGVHAHVEVLNPQGHRVDPASVIGQKVAPPPPDGRRIDEASAYKFIDGQVAAGNWTRARGERAKQRLAKDVSLNDQIRARAETDARRALDGQLANMFANGEKPTSFAKFSPDAVAQLSPSDRLQYEQMFAANRKPQAPEANGQTALELTLQSINEPEKFKQTNLITYQGQMTRGEFASLATAQARMRNEKVGVSPTANLRSEIDRTIRFYSPDIALDTKKADKPGTTERQQYLTIFNAMQAHIERITEGKRAPTDAEMKSAFDRATMEVTVTVPGWLGDRHVRTRAYAAYLNNPGANVQVEVPPDARTRIVSAYQAVHGRAPMDREIAVEYLNHKGQPGYWQ